MIDHECARRVQSGYEAGGGDSFHELARQVQAYRQGARLYIGGKFLNFLVATDRLDIVLVGLGIDGFAPQLACAVVGIG